MAKRVWTGLGVNYGHQITDSKYDAQQVTADLNYLYALGVRRLRLAYVTYRADSIDTATITRLKATAVQAMNMGFYVMWGFTAGDGSSAFTAVQWGEFKTYVTGTFATWATSVSLSEMSMGNEEESHAINGGEVTAATVRADIKTIAGTVKSGGYLGKVSYSSETNHSNVTNWTTDGMGTNLDYLHFNEYDIVEPNFYALTKSIARAFSGKSGLTEWGSEGSGYADFNDEEQFYRDTQNRLQAIKDAGLPFAYFFNYRGTGSLDAYALQSEKGNTRRALRALAGANEPIRKLNPNVGRSVAFAPNAASASARVTVNSNAAINYTATSQYSWVGRVKFMYRPSTSVLGVVVYQGLDATSGYQIYFDPGGLMYWQERKANGAWHTTNRYYPSMYNRWIDWAVTYDGTAQVIHMYIDGVEVPSTVGNLTWSNAIDDTTHGLLWGKASNSESVNGGMADCGMYGRVLTQAEVVAFSNGIVPVNPIIFHKMDDGITNAGNTTAADSSKNGLTGTLSSSLWGADAPSQSRIFNRAYTKSLAFNGSTDYATLPITPTTGGFSFAMWLYAAPLPAGTFGRIFDYYDAAGNGTRMLINLNSSTNRFVTFDARTAGSGGVNSTNNTIRPGRWMHVVGTNDGAGKCLIYINGTCDNRNASSTYTVPTAEVFTLGRASDASSNFGAFLMSEFVYKNGTAFTPAEVTALYQKGIIPAGVTCVIDCNNNVADKSGNGNAMTLNGTTYSSNVPFKARQALGATRTAIT